jgi:hypothetical protein
MVHSVIPQPSSALAGWFYPGTVRLNALERTQIDIFRGNALFRNPCPRDGWRIDCHERAMPAVGAWGYSSLLSFWYPRLVGIAIVPDFLIMDFAEEFRNFRNALFGTLYLLRMFVLSRSPALAALALAIFRTKVQFLPQAGFDHVDIRRIQIELLFVCHCMFLLTSFACKRPG